MGTAALRDALEQRLGRRPAVGAPDRAASPLEQHLDLLRTQQAGRALTGGTAVPGMLRAVGRQLRAAPLDIPRQVGRGLAESGYASAIGLTRLLEAAGRAVGQETTRETPLSETLRQSREEARQFYGQPETPIGQVAGVGARLAGDVAQYMTPAGVLKAAGLAAPASLAGRVGLQVATGAPVTAAMAAAGPEESLVGGLAQITGSERLGQVAAHPAARIGFDVAVDAILGGTAEAIPALLRRSKGLQEAVRATGDAARIHDIDALANEASDLSLLETRTPEQAARLQELGRQLQAAAATLPPPARTAAEVAAAAQVEPELPRSIVERERRRVVGSPPGGGERRVASGVPPAAVETGAGEQAAAPVAAPEPATVTLPSGQVVSQAPESAARRAATGPAPVEPSVVPPGRGPTVPAAAPAAAIPAPPPAAAPPLGERGAAARPAVEALSRAGAGAAAGAIGGAALEPEHPVRGAVTGGLAGAALLAGVPPLMRALRSGERAAAPVLEDVAAAVRPGPPPVFASAINPDEYVNVAKFALDPTGEARLREEVVKVVQTEHLHPKQRVSWDETRAIAQEIGLSPDDVLKGEAARLNGAEMLAIRNVVRTNVEEIERLTRTLGSGPVAAEEADRLTRAIANREDQNAALLGRFTRARTAAGRNLNNLKILAQRTNDPVVWLAKAQQIAGEAGFDLEVQTKVRELLNTDNREELVRYLASLRQASWGEKATTLWKAGLLTNPKTHIVNITSNTTMAALETAKDNPAVLFDWLLAKVTGQRTKAPTTAETLRASWEGARQGAREARDLLRGRPVEEALSKFDIPKEVHFDNAILETYTQTVFGLLNAEDRVFRGAALQRSLAEQAQVLAKREGLQGEARLARVRELRANPPDELATQAIADAEVSTFRDVTALSQAASGFRHLGTLGELVLPFRRTPSAVATRVLEYSPIGFGKGGLEAIAVWRAATAGKAIGAAQKRAAEILGRATTGLAPLTMGYLLYREGLATGAAPASQRERERWRLEGRQPNSVLLGGEWRNVGRLSPAGNLFAVGANMAAALDADETPSFLERAGQLGVASLRTVADQPFVTGLRTATEAIINPVEQGSRAVTDLAGSVVPAGVAATARAFDPTVRKPAGIGETIQSRLPVASRGVRPVRNVFGQEVQRDPSVLATLLDPTSPQRDVRQQDALIREMGRVGAGIPPLKKAPEESADAFATRQVEYGQRTRARLERVIRSAAYGRADADRQRDLIEDAVTDLRRALAKHQRRRDRPGRRSR